MARRSRNEEAAMDSYFYARVRGEIVGTYAQAESDLAEKLRRFTALFEAQDREKRAQLDAGTITKAEYDSWLRGAVFRGERWKAVRQECVDQIHRANETTARMLNGERRALFQKAANYSAYQIERGTQGAVNFTLYDSATVTRLIQKRPKLLPDLTVGKRRDESWNGRGIQNAITQGIIQGESIPDIAKRIAHQTGERNRAALTRQARTAMTGAQNAGRVQAMWEAEEEGIKIQKKWIATLDKKTRDAHAELDGQIVDADQPFIVDGKEIMYPGDPNADPSLVYNCRCTLGWVYPDHPSAPGARRDNETGEVIGGVSYAEWEQGKTEPVKPEAAAAILPRHMDFVPAESIKEAEEQAKSYLSDGGKASYRGLSLDAANACNRVLGDVGATFNVPGLDSIQPMNMRSNVFKNSTAEAAYRWGMNGSLFINPTFYKSASALAAHKAEIDGLMSTVMNGGQALIDSGRATGKKRDYIEALLRTGRQCVSQSHDFLEGTFVHECGHRLDDQIFRKALIEAFGVDRVKYADRLAESRRQYGGGISGYAIADNAEYMAESFSAWWYGESSIIDPIIKGVFEKLVKK